MDRRNFIKLTAVTGTSAALTACGNPEHQLIRFVPEDEIVPGVAEWKPSVCPMCAAGCGLTVRVMDADFETTRNGQAGVVATRHVDFDAVVDAYERWLGEHASVEVLRDRLRALPTRDLDAG